LEPWWFVLAGFLTTKAPSGGNPQMTPISQIKQGKSAFIGEIGGQPCPEIRGIRVKPG
jgi:hypothetical protein